MASILISEPQKNNNFGGILKMKIDRDRPNLIKNKAFFPKH